MPCMIAPDSKLIAMRGLLRVQQLGDPVLPSHDFVLSRHSAFLRLGIRFFGDAIGFFDRAIRSSLDARVRLPKGAFHGQEQADYWFPKTFDDQLEGFVSFSKPTRSGPGHRREADRSRSEGAARPAPGRSRSRAHLTRRCTAPFMEDQSGRYSRYITVLSVLRAANRDNASVLAGLAQFKRPRAGKPAANRRKAK